MKQSMSPAVAGVIIVIAVVVLGLVGWRYLGGSRNSSGAPPPEAQKWINPGSGMTGNVSPNQQPQGSTGSPMMGSGSMAPPPGAYGNR